MTETMYGNARFLWPPGNDAAVDERLKDLREQLDETGENQRACRPDDLDEYDENWMAQMYQMHSHVIRSEGYWEKRLHARSERIAAEEKAAWHEMEERARSKSKQDADQKEEGDQSKDKKEYDQDMEMEVLIELNKTWYGTGSGSHTRGKEGSG